MPELCRFYGMVISMMYNDDSKHHKPHIHIKFNGATASVGIDGEILAGNITTKQMRLVQAWIVLHEDELYDAWNQAVKGNPIGKIEPLR